MSTFTETIIETFHVVSCYHCAARFGIQHELYKRVVTDASGSVYCPACGRESCWRESEAQRKIKDLQQKLTWEAGEVARQKSARESAEASLHAMQGVVTRMKRRSAAGVCPCCQRTFKQLAVHMAQKHPSYAAKE